VDVMELTLEWEHNISLIMELQLNGKYRMFHILALFQIAVWLCKLITKIFLRLFSKIKLMYRVMVD